MNVKRTLSLCSIAVIILVLLGYSGGFGRPQSAWAQAEPDGELAKRTKTPTPIPTPTFILTAPPPVTDTPTVEPTATLIPLPSATPQPTATALPPSPTPITGQPGVPTATPSPTAPPTVTNTPTPQPVIQTLTLAVLDGWDELFADRLSQLDQVGVIASSDDDAWEIAANSYTSFEFENPLLTDATIQSVKLYIEHSEDSGLAAEAINWEVGQGDLQKPTILQTQHPTLLTIDTETAEEWDVTAWINTPAQIQALKLVIRNTAPSQSTWIDHLYLVVTYIGDVAIPPTPTPLPAAINLQGQVQLEGRPAPPNPQWAMPLNVNLRTTDVKGSSSTRGFSLLTGADGAFQMNDLAAGSYQVAVKGAHTLQRVVNVDLQTGSNPVDFGLLLEGDAVNDNRINILDFSRLASAFGRCANMTNYLASADFDQDGCITQRDVGLLVQNFGQMGEVLNAPQEVEAASTLTVFPLGRITNKQAGDRFTILLSASQADNQPVDAVALYLNFDPTQLEIVSLAGSARLPTVLLQQVDKVKSQLNYAAGFLGEGVTGSPALMAITFIARRNIKSTSLIIETAGLRQSIFAFRGQTLNSGATNGNRTPIAMQEVVLNQSIFLPLIHTMQ